MNLNLKQALLKEARLLSISQSDCDLFIIGQTNTITYEQLALTGIHGITKTSGRLAVKKLEKEGYLAAKTMQDNTKTKYYFLTAKGKKRLERVCGSAFLEKMCFDLERRPPASQQQLPHRIHTSDLYFTYLNNPCLDHLPLWRLESPYKSPEGTLPPPRCDGLLQTPYGTYYIEQDNCTQGEGALGKKISQYMSAECFLGKDSSRHALIFTLYAETKERPVKIPPYSVYRILLKAVRVWETLEEECDKKFSFTTFCIQFKTNPSPSLLHLSNNDRAILNNLCLQHPNLVLGELEQLKKNFLYDTSLEEGKDMERDTLFAKRLRQKFYPLLEVKEQATLQYRLKKGMRMYVLPNHRLSDYLPFALQKEYLFGDFLRRLLFHMGLNELESWRYHSLFCFQDINGKEYTFRNVFVSVSGIQIVSEDIAHDLGGRERVSHYLKHHVEKKNILFVLFVGSRDDAFLFLERLDATLHKPENNAAHICFVDKSASLYQNPDTHTAYFPKRIPDGILWLPTLIDYDDFLAELHLVER